MWELKHKEGWVAKNWWFRTVVLEKTLESPLNCKKIKPVNSKGNQPWIFTGRARVEDVAAIHTEKAQPWHLFEWCSIKLMVTFMTHRGSQAQQATAVRVVPAWPHSGYLGLETTQPCFLLKLLLKEFSPQLTFVCPSLAALKLLQMHTLPLRRLHHDDRLKKPSAFKSGSPRFHLTKALKLVTAL